MDANADAFSGGSDHDDVFDEDMEALRRACMITGRSPGEIRESDGESGGDESSDSDDIDLLRKIRKQFALTATPEGDDDPLVVKPLNSSLMASDEDEDDFETLSAIQRRFQRYQSDALQKNHEQCLNDIELVATGIETGEEISEALLEKRNGQFLDHEPQPSVEYELPSVSGTSLEDELRDFNHMKHGQDGAFKFTAMPRHFSKSCQLFVDALKKNRTCQKFIRTKMIQIEAKVEQNKDLKERVRCLMDFQSACRRRAGRILSQKKDPCVRLISLPMSRMSSKAKILADYGPAENSHVSEYKMVLTRFPISLKRQRWTKSEEEKLAKGIKQQYQEMLLLSSMELENTPGGSFGDSNILSVSSLGDFDIASESIRSFLPFVNWDRLASMYVTGRTGAECEARWLNSADPLINKSPWTITEDKNILLIAQSRGVFNWIDIAVRLGTHRTPFQCLFRYQRSLNAYILKKDWTEEEDAQLCAAVETYGEDWQFVASSLEGRTGPQCSNRWRKTLHPDRKKVGRWSIEEDKRLKVAVLLFGAKNWNKIAQFAPGRTQSQCRERWVNCLDPSLNLGPWTEEEDSKLKAAIAEFGHCWSKVATFVPPRTDSQCRRRWKVLLPHEVPLLQAALKMKKAVLISNFVDREKERPLIGPEDFYFIGGNVSSADENGKGNGKRKKTNSEEGLKQKKQRNTHSLNGHQPAVSKCKSKQTSSKEVSALCDQTKTSKDKDIPRKVKKGNRRPLLERKKQVQTIENHDVISHLEPAISDFTGTEPAAPDGIPMIDVPHLAANINCSEDIARIMDDDCLLLDSTLHNVDNELPEIMSIANQEAGISPEKGNSQKNGKTEKVFESTQRTPPTLDNGPQSASDRNCSKEIAKIADDDCLLLDWIFGNVVMNKLPEITDNEGPADDLVCLSEIIQKNRRKRVSKIQQKNSDCAQQASGIPPAEGTT